MIAHVEEYIDKFTWYRAVCDACGWKAPTAHASEDDAKRDAERHVCGVGNRER